MKSIIEHISLHIIGVGGQMLFDGDIVFCDSNPVYCWRLDLHKRRYITYAVKRDLKWYIDPQPASNHITSGKDFYKRNDVIFNEVRVGIY